jgi:phosphate-selective porin OprO/OprP
VTPKRPFDLKKGGWGALELVGRYSMLRVDPDTFPTFASISTSAQEARAWAVGLNWYLNRNVKFVLDYEQTDFDGGAAGGKDRDTEQVVFTRAQVAF